MIYVSAEHEVCFVHVPRNGGTSVINALGMPEDGGHAGWQRYAHERPWEWRKYFCFAVIRDPFERVESCYKHAQMVNSHWFGEDKVRKSHMDHEMLRGVTFEKAVCEYLPLQKLQQEGWGPQWPMIGSYEPLHNRLTSPLDAKVPFPDLPAFMQRQFGIELPLLNASKTLDNMDWTPRMRNVVQALYAIDILVYAGITKQQELQESGSAALQQLQAESASTEAT